MVFSMSSTRASRSPCISLRASRLASRVLISGECSLYSQSLCRNIQTRDCKERQLTPFYSAYFIGPLTYSGWFVRRFGYRYTFILGLSIYCVGALMFWPSAVKRSFGGFCGSMFIVGSGLSTLETSANP